MCGEQYLMPRTPGMCPMPVNPRNLIRQLQPLVRYGVREAHVTGVTHAMMEVALVAYLMGMGYDCQTAYRLVESWEVNESFPGGY